MFNILYSRTDRFVFDEGTYVGDNTSRKSEVDTLNRVTEGKVVYGIVIYAPPKKEEYKDVCVCTQCTYILLRFPYQTVSLSRGRYRNLTHTLYCP